MGGFTPPSSSKWLNRPFCGYFNRPDPPDGGDPAVHGTNLRGAGYPAANNLQVFALKIGLRCKNISVPFEPKSPAYSVPSHPLEGRIAIVTDAGWDAVDAEALLTNSADADGEVVWS